MLLLYLRYPFLYYLSYGYILSNTYTSTSLLLFSVDLYPQVYLLEIVCTIFSFIVHLDFSVVVLLTFCNFFSVLMMKGLAVEKSCLEDVVDRIRYFVGGDYRVRRDEYSIVYDVYVKRGNEMNYNIASEEKIIEESECNNSKNIDYISENKSIDTLKSEDSEIKNTNKHIENKHTKSNLRTTKIFINKDNFYIRKDKQYKQNLLKRNQPNNSYYYNLDLFTPLILLKKDINILFLLIGRLLPLKRFSHLYFIFIFFYILEFKVVSFVINLFCNHLCCRNVGMRIYCIVGFYYLYWWLF
ncbi:hypothetical protein NAPIS_ORF01806 [Vairimorpha apis BRL 01]|uniref:Uncharacterized protein n=1 Tax=Vairimorpha apis BRL 01 TaxID=1037528 RepID=T0KZC0_9MICR|nr:hypothetical protein NAPIS_ORF01806 [Vairimorpha apis BRL 01]